MMNGKRFLLHFDKVIRSFGQSSCQKLAILHLIYPKPLVLFKSHPSLDRGDKRHSEWVVFFVLNDVMKRDSGVVFIP